MAEQPDEQDDYDLLTYGEAGARLAREIAIEQKTIAELTGGDGSQADEGAVQRHRDRLVALEEAQRRCRKQPVNDENFEKFFGYPAAPSS
jgi:hypothetical protein